MRKRTLFGVSALAFFPGAVLADAPAPLPPVVQKYVQAVQGLSSVTVDAVQTQPATPADTAHLILQAPNRLRLTSVSDGKTVTVVSDGATVSQWDDTRSDRQPAPATWDKIAVVLRTGAAADIAESLLTDPTTITDYANLRDAGPVSLGGRPAEKVVSVEDGDTATFWLSPATGLPLQAAFTGGRRDRTVTLHYSDSPLTADTFQASVPAGLTAYTASKDPELLTAGTPAPDFSLHRAGAHGLTPQTVSLSSLKGRVVLIDFWASRCRPCKKTMPHIQALREAWGGKGVTFLSINTWDQQPRMAVFLKTHPQYTTTMLCDPSPANKSVAVSKYNISGIPTVYVIDRTGKVAGTFIGDDPGAAKGIETTLAGLETSAPKPSVATAETALLPAGAPAPDFTLPTADDAKPITLSTLQGHPVLLDFWASWCPPCKKGLPHTQALADAFGRKGLTVLAVNSWDTKAGMKAFLKAHPEYTMTVLFDPREGVSGHRQGSIAHDLYKVTGIPTIYLIDKDGHIAASFEGYGDDTEDQIRAALAKLGIS